MFLLTKRRDLLPWPSSQYAAIHLGYWCGLDVHYHLNPPCCPLLFKVEFEEYMIVHEHEFMYVAVFLIIALKNAMKY